MPRSLQEFAAELHQEVLAEINADGPGSGTGELLREEAFTAHVVGMLTEHSDTVGVEVIPYEANTVRGANGAPAAKLSAWSMSRDKTTADFFVSLYHGTGEVEDVGLPEMRRHFKLLGGFLHRALDGFHALIEESSDAFPVMQKLHAVRDLLTTVRLFFLTDGRVRTLKVDEEQFPGIDVRYVVWDLEKLSHLNVSEREAIELNFAEEEEGAIPCLETADSKGEYQTFLAFFPARRLAHIYGQHGQRLLERNVRAFLQAKGKINRGLQKTLKEEPHRFLAYNNGLCCTAAEVRTCDGRLEWVKDFQIVNGGQTTASIYHALMKDSADLGQVTVQVKLTVLKDPAMVTEMVPLISRYANSQNKVNGADFAANGPFHLSIEHLSRTVWTLPAGGLQRSSHWYYERARGSYADDKARQPAGGQRSKWESENPAPQKFTKTDLAKYEHAWLGLPYLVCWGAEKNFNKLAERMSEAGEPEVDRKYFEHLIAKTILFRTAEKVFSTRGLVGFRANSVAYAVAWLSERSGWRIDLNRIWTDQRLSPVLKEALGIVCDAAHAHISGFDGNPGEWSKKEACWTQFVTQQLPALGDAWKGEWADAPFAAPATEEDTLAAEWEKVRGKMQKDHRTIEALESDTNREWISKHRPEAVAAFAAEDWKGLKKKTGKGLKKLRVLVEMFAAAAVNLKD